MLETSQKIMNKHSSQRLMLRCFLTMPQWVDNVDLVQKGITADAAENYNTYYPPAFGGNPIQGSRKRLKVVGAESRILSICGATLRHLQFLKYFFGGKIVLLKKTAPTHTQPLQYCLMPRSIKKTNRFGNLI